MRWQKPGNRRHQDRLPFMPEERMHIRRPDMDENALIAARLREYADLLEAQALDGFRVRAYRNAAREIDACPTPLRKIHAEGGIEALIALPAIGQGIAAAIVEMLTTGRWRQLDHAKNAITPETLFSTIPGIGGTLARRLKDRLHVETLEDLDHALRLGDRKVEGIGPRRREAILATLGQRLAGMRRADPSEAARAEPPVDLLLDADALYRAEVAAGHLKRIAPKRFNPTGAAWLPIMHARRGDWHLTVMFSNTALAHQLGRTDDWVVIYFHQHDAPEARCTVVTETRGPMAGKRVVRGRERDCAAFHETSSVLSDPAL
jgi:DNA uptake protein ComE-like DNA-binding protein